LPVLDNVKENIGAVLLYYPLEETKSLANGVTILGKHRFVDNVCFPFQRQCLQPAALTAVRFALPSKLGAKRQRL